MKRRTSISISDPKEEKAKALSPKLPASRIPSVDSSCAQEAPKNPEPKIKASTDFSWVNKPFKQMSPEEGRAYSLLGAIADCSVDYFSNVRGLLKWAGEDQSDLCAAAVLRALDKLRIKHDYTAAEIQDVVRIIQPGASRLLDPCELEKAVEAVRESRGRRWPKGCAGRGAEPVPFGQRARELSIAMEQAQDLAEKMAAANKDNEFEDPFEDCEPENRPEPRTAFGIASFVECVLLLGMHHMHGNGVPVKTAAPGGVKCLWLIAFLHARFEAAALKYTASKTEPTRKTNSHLQPIHTDISDSPSLRPPASPNKTPKGGFSRLTSGVSDPLESDAAKLSKAMTAAQNRSKAAKADDAVNAQRQREKSTTSLFSKRRISLPGMSTGDSHDEFSDQDSGKQNFEELSDYVPRVSEYVSRLQEMIMEKPDLFSRWLDGAGDDEAVIRGGRGANEFCDNCGRKADWRGLGSVFCHVCSGVDWKLPSESILFPVFERARQRRIYADLQSRAKASELRAKKLALAAAELAKAAALPPARPSVPKGHR